MEAAAHEFGAPRGMTTSQVRDVLAAMRRCGWDRPTAVRALDAAAASRV